MHTSPPWKQRHFQLSAEFLALRRFPSDISSSSSNCFTLFGFLRIYSSFPSRVFANMGTRQVKHEFQTFIRLMTIKFTQLKQRVFEGLCLFTKDKDKREKY